MKFLLLPIVLAAVCTTSSYAGRLYGNASISYEHLERTDDSLNVSDDITRESLIISYEDALFVKNRMRLTANLQRREFPFTGYREFQPIYYLDLKSYGYNINVRHSRYTRRSILAGTTGFLDVHHRDWRVTTTVNYDDWPVFNVVYSRLENFDDLDRSRYDGYNRNVILDGNYTVGPASIRANYNNLKRVNNTANGLDATNETYTATGSFSKNVNGLGYFSTTYNYYDTHQETNDLTTQNSLTHSLTSLLSATPLPSLSLTASYSGRFTEASRRAIELKSDDQNMTARLEYSPVSYISAFANKGYQINAQSNDFSIVEYLTLGATATRYLHRGIESRLTANRTTFQQSQRLITVRDSLGNVIRTFNDGDYTVDTYNASFNFSPRPYIRTYLDLTMTYNHDPLDEDRRYQLTRSLDARIDFTRRLQGRFTFTSIYDGSVLKLTSAFSENYNVGLTYNPFTTMNFNLTYIYNRYTTAIRSENESITGYMSYSYRRAFTLYLSYNDRNERRRRIRALQPALPEVDINPSTINGQITIYLSRKTTLAVSYLKTESQNTNGIDISDESIQTVVTIQI